MTIRPPIMPIGPKFFNIAGPCDPDRHYMLPSLERLSGVNQLLDQGLYFTIQAARQSGKTTYLLALADAINQEGRFDALYCSLESARRIKDDEVAIPRIVDILDAACQEVGWEGLPPSFFGGEARRTPSTLLRTALTHVCRSLDKPLVVFFDEADCLEQGPLYTFLSQIRHGYIGRRRVHFPWSMALVGMRNIRDYVVKTRPDSESQGTSSPFNIITEAMSLANFTPEEVAALYGQHTEATGQAFLPEAIERAWWWTEGQPWLVNAIARQVIMKDLDNDCAVPVTGAHMDAAADVLCRRRDTHIESLLARLKEPRVRRVMEPVLTGDGEVEKYDDDLLYCTELGLVTHVRINAGGRPEGVRPANPIYSEVIWRTLTGSGQDKLPSSLVHRWMKKGLVDMQGLLEAFQEFWRENSEIWAKNFEYTEAIPHLTLHSFLQRVVNGGAHIQRESALGRGRVDILVEYEGRRYPIELKMAGVHGRTPAKALREGLEQLAGYMARCNANEGWLVLFDRDPSRTWEEKIFWKKESVPGGLTIYAAGC